MWQPEPEHNSDENVHNSVTAAMDELFQANADGDEHDTYHNETHDKIHLFGEEHYFPREDEEQEEHHEEIPGEDEFHPDDLDDDGNPICDAAHCAGCLQKEPCDVSAVAPSVVRASCAGNVHICTCVCGTAPRLRGWFSERWGGRMHVEHEETLVLPEENYAVRSRDRHGEAAW